MDVAAINPATGRTVKVYPEAAGAIARAYYEAWRAKPA
jgi:hypothetical protein